MAFWSKGICPFVLCFFFLSFSDALLTCPSGIFAFGDSLTDTGNYGTLYPSKLEFDYMKTTLSTASDTNVSSKRPFFTSNKSLPYRAGDGRLIIDFIAEAFGFPFLNANYRKGQDFSHGVNYAVSSATARDTAIAVPYYLSVQVKNYIEWKTNGWVPSSLVSKSLFFVFIGLNDFWQNCMNYKYTAAQVKSTVVPDAVRSINNAIYNLHSNGARTILVVGVPAVGCLPSFLSNFGTGVSSDYDSLGCLAAHNDAAKTFNSMLYGAVQKAQSSMADSRILFADLYELHRDAVTSPSNYGLTVTKTACCVNGACCSNPGSYITWDGLHFTEGFNRLVATNFLKGYYVQDSFNSACRLDFSKF